MAAAQHGAGQGRLHLAESEETIGIAREEEHRAQDHRDPDIP